MNPYTVIYVVQGDICWQFFECLAESADHAEEQLEDAELDAHILWVNEGHGEESRTME